MVKIIKKPVTLESGKSPALSFKEPKTFIAAILSSGFFLGYFPAAQGTIGSFWIPCVLSAIHFLYPEFQGAYYQSAIIIMIFATFFAGVWASGVCEKIWGHDPGRVVIDEITGTFIAILFIPLSFTGVWLGFLFFRFFDIFKFYPANIAEKLPGGWGVMADDVVAGVYANLLTRAALLSIAAFM